MLAVILKFGGHLLELRTLHAWLIKLGKPENPAMIGAALREAIAADETVVVDVATDIEARAPEPWLPAT